MKRYGNGFVYIIAIIAVLANPGVAQEQVPEGVQAAAKKGYDAYRKLVTERNYKELGFGSREEIDKTLLGTPIREFMVRLDELKRFSPETDPGKLLKGGEVYTYPLLLDNNVRSSLTVGRVGNAWNVVSYGSPNKIRLIESVRGEIVSAKHPASSIFLVKVPALYFNFLGFRDEDRLLLVPILNDKKLDFKAGERIPAEKVFVLLSKEAMEYNLPE